MIATEAALASEYPAASVEDVDRAAQAAFAAFRSFGTSAPATRAQLLRCYPQLPEFLRLKRHYDPNERFQSEWYRHMVSVIEAP